MLHVQVSRFVATNGLTLIKANGSGAHGNAVLAWGPIEIVAKCN